MSSPSSGPATPAEAQRREGPREVRRPPRRYPGWVLKLAYAAEWFFARVLPGKRWYSELLRCNLRCVTHQICIPDLPESFNGYRIVHLSDFHGGPFLDAASLAPVIDAVNAMSADLVVLTGDYLTHVVDEGVDLAPALGQIRAADGVFAVFGNHDYRERREGEMVSAFGAFGIRTLRNQGEAIRRGGSAIWIAGIEDIEEGKSPDLEAALAGREEAGASCTVLLAHHPDASGAAEDREVSLVLSGHTHGGQIVLGGRSVLPMARSQYRHGVYRLGTATQLHVTSGVGVLLIPCRIGARPEVACLELLRGSGSSRVS